MTDLMPSAIALSPFDWQEAEVGTLRPRSQFLLRLDGERPRYEEIFTVISVFDERFLEVRSTECDDNLTIKTTFKEFSFSSSDIVLVVPYYERSIALEDQSNA